VLEVVEQGNAVVDGDPVLLEQAIANLVVNAVHASAGPGRVRILVGRGSARPPADHGGAPGAYVHVTVEDHGQGISAEALPHIFEPFFTTKGIGEGTGLGLPVSDGIAREHGGWIEVETTPAAGSRFTVYLPEAPAAEPARQRTVS